MANKDPLLDRGAFGAQQNNFSMHFLPDNWGDIYRTHAAYQKCMEAHPEEFGALSKRLQSYAGTRFSAEHADLLYPAYRMMHPYADSNSEMFL